MSTAARLAILGALALAVTATVALRPDHLPSAAEASPPADASPPAVVAVPRLVDLGADNCIPCKAMMPVLDELRREYAGRLRVDFIDVNKFPDQAEPFRIYAIPTQIFFDPSGRELGRHVGFISKEDILATWRRLGYPLTPREKQ
jgi:thioredoxin 1